LVIVLVVVVVVVAFALAGKVVNMLVGLRERETRERDAREKR